MLLEAKPLFGYQVDLPTNKISSCLDIVKCYLLYLHDDKHFSRPYNLAKVIANQMKEIYVKTNGPSINLSSIAVRVKRLILLICNFDTYPSIKKIIFII